MRAINKRPDIKFVRSRQRGFTLLELLVVIALTSLLLLLIFKPLTDAFNLTSRAGTQIEAQTSARNIQREVADTLANASFVFDNAQTPLNIWLQNRGGNAHVVRTRFTMVEYVRPARQMDQVPGKTPIDPTVGTPIFSDGDARAKGFALPLAPGRALGRYFIGLLNNSSAADPQPGRSNGVPRVLYANNFEDPNNIFGGNINRYTLYKAEVLTYIPDPDRLNDPNVPYIPNLALFHTYNPANPAQVTDNIAHPLQLHDPNFFYDNSLAGGTGDKKWALPGWKDLNADGKVQICENWRAISSSLLPLNKVDMIALDRTETGNQIAYYTPNADGSPGAIDNGNNAQSVPAARPLALFSPSAINNDPGVPGSVSNTGNESPNAAAPIYSTEYSHWAVPYSVQVFRNPAEFKNQNPNADPLTLDPVTFYMMTGEPGFQTKIARIQSAPNIAAPKSIATLPDVGPNPNPTNGSWRNPDGTLRNPAVANPEGFAFQVDSRRGLINFAFSASVLVGFDNNNAGVNPLPSRYSAAEANEGMESPINRRFLVLRALPQTDPFTGFPLNDPNGKSPLDVFYTTLDRVPRVHIVPGSERVFGPDQRPGPHYGYRIQYTRVSNGASFVGKNEYKINYEDVLNAQAALDPNDPRLRIGYVEFNSIPDSQSLFNLFPNLRQLNDPNADIRNQEDPTGQQSGGVPIYRPNGLPLYKAVGGQRVEADPVEIYYDFQLNRNVDVVKNDYLTRSLMNFALEVRLYDPRSGRPQSTSLTNRIKVRNLQR